MPRRLRLISCFVYCPQGLRFQVDVGVFKCPTVIDYPLGQSQCFFFAFSAGWAVLRRAISTLRVRLIAANSYQQWCSGHKNSLSLSAEPCAVCNRNRFLDGGGYKKSPGSKKAPQNIENPYRWPQLWLLNHAVILPKTIHVKLHGVELLFSGKQVAFLKCL